MSAAAPPAALDALMAAMPSYGSEFTGTFANHAPMVLTALDRIGGDGRRLGAFFDHYRASKGLLPMPARIAPLDADGWPAAIGARHREADLRDVFVDEVARLGREGAVRTHLPRLAPGVAASAFHALMRLAYGLLRDSDTDVAIALAYWAATYLPLPPATGAPPVTDDPAEVLTRAMAIDGLREAPVHDLLWQTMRDAAALPAFAPVVDWLDVGPRTMERMAATGLALFAGTQHFAALHVVTGLHWIRVVAPFTDAATVATLLRVFWQGVAALSGELGFPTLPDAPTLQRWRAVAAPPWSVIHAAAAASYDEHDVSLAFSAFEEERAWGDPLYRVVAARRLGLVADYAR